MPKDQSDFFKKLQPWSRIKNDLLAVYLVPYFAKISATRKKTFYVDCFAGKGKFEDGNDGSPFLAIKKRTEALSARKGNPAEIELAFIEKVHASELRKNLADAFPSVEGYSVISGSFESDLAELLRGRTNQNLFLYVDPFGIKSLQFHVFKTLRECGHFRSFEILMNFNSFGFIRAAQSILAKNGTIQDKWDKEAHTRIPTSDAELEPFDSSLKSVEDLNSVANGDYWIDIVRRYANTPLGFKDAEKELAEAYRKELSSVFKYVLKMPIGKKNGSIPEYCMFFMTNHPDGCLIMVDNMMKRADSLRVDVQQGGQLQLFDQDVNNDFVDLERVRSDFRSFVKDELFKDGVVRVFPIDDLKARFFAKYGVVCKPVALNHIFAEMENSGILQVSRSPKQSRAQSGAKRVKSQSFNTKEQSIFVSWKT